jgi:hypothetical protein
MLTLSHLAMVSPTDGTARRVLAKQYTHSMGRSIHPPHPDKGHGSVFVEKKREAEEKKKQIMQKAAHSRPFSNCH